MPLAATDGDDLIDSGEVDSLDGHAHPEELRVKWKLEATLQHGEETNALLGLPVCIHGGLLDELVELRLAPRLASGLLPGLSASLFHGSFMNVKPRRLSQVALSAANLLETTLERCESG